MNEVAKLETGNGSMLPAAAHGTNAMAATELFVINLCASMTPMPAVPKNLKGFEKYKLYQVSRQEDGRRRFRLRLGFFTSEADAEWVLNSVRGLYPAAFTGCVNAEDLRYTGDAIPSTTPSVSPAAAPVPTASLISQPVVTPKPSVTVTPAPVKAAPAPVKANVVKPSAATAVAATPATNNKPVVAPAPAKPSPALTASIPDPTPQPAANTQSYGQPFHVGRGVELPEMDLELTDEHEILSAPAKPAPAPVAPQVKQPAAATARNAAAASSAASRPAPANIPSSDGPIRSASIISPPKVVDDYVPILDTTLTIRTLTKAEAEDPNRPKWFAVQLAISEQPINLDTMPKLDIFAAYTLYCVATMEGNTIKHALRLGFFRENVSAEAVMGYLKAFFNQPSINQISTAEFERFSEPKPKAKTAAEPDAKVVNLDAKRPGAPVKPLAPIAAQKPVAQQVGKPVSNKPPRTNNIPAAPARPQSFLSRLIGRQLD